MHKLSMMLTIPIAALFCLSSALSYAESWSGALVDSKCYDSMERNVNPTDTMTNVDRDTNLEIRYCSPSPKTKAFAVVLQDGRSFRLDSAGNAEAAQLVRNAGKKSRFLVAITGTIAKGMVKVDSISMAP